MVKNLFWILILCLSGTINTSIAEYSDDHVLVDQWQDYVLANAIATNYLNILMVLSSNSDFSLINSSDHCTIYIQNPKSFRETITELADDIRHVLRNIYQDLNRIQHDLERIPIHLKTVLLLVKKGSKDSIQKNLPVLLKKGEILFNENFAIFKNPQSKLEHIKDVLSELNSLTSDYILKSQIEDVKTQWILLIDLFTQLSIQAEKITNNFILQFNWLFEEFNHLDIDTYRDLLINLLQSKVIEIDRTIDLLTIISQTYIHLSLEYTNNKLNSNTHLMHISSEKERKEILKQYRYELKPEAVKIARYALTKHDEYLQRNQNRNITYEKFLNDMSQTDLNVLLTIN